MTSPLLLVDVDGVLFPWQAPDCPSGFEVHEWPDEDPVWLSQEHGAWLRELAAVFDLVWATGWGHDANRMLSPRLDLPELPVIEFPPVPFPPEAKVPAIAACTAGRAAAWIDDQLGEEARAWAADRTEPTLLLDVDPAVGLTRPHVDRLFGCAEYLSGSPH